MKLSLLPGRLALLAAVIGGTAGAGPAQPVVRNAAADGAARAGWERRADAYAMEARFYRAAGKPTAAFLARRSAALSAAYRRRVLTEPGPGVQ